MSITDQPHIYILFDPLARKYWAINKWTRFAEDATEYPSFGAARRRGADLKSKLGRELKIVPTEPHQRR